MAQRWNESASEGSTQSSRARSTSNAERRPRRSRARSGSISRLIFLDGTSLLSRADAGIATLADVAGKRVGVIQGTTTEHVLYDAFKQAALSVQVVNVKYSRDGLVAVDQQRVEAYAGDRAVLVNLALISPNPDRYAIIDSWLSYEPCGLMLRRDPDFRVAVNRQLARIYRSGSILELRARRGCCTQPAGW